MKTSSRRSDLATPPKIRRIKSIWSASVWRRSLKWCLSMQRNQNIVETNNVRPENGEKRWRLWRERGQTLVRRDGRRNADDGETNKQSSQNVYADIGRHSHCGLSFHDSNLLEIKETEAPATGCLCVCVPEKQSWPNMLEFEWRSFFPSQFSRPHPVALGAFCYK